MQKHAATAFTMSTCVTFIENRRKARKKLILYLYIAYISEILINLRAL